MKKKTVDAGDLANHLNEKIKIHGSIYKIRRMSGFAFILLRTKRNVVQCIYSNEFSLFELEELTEESCVIATAQVIPEERSKAGYELRLIEVEIYQNRISRVPL